VYWVDAGDESVYGISKTDFRLHYCVGLFDLGMKEIRLTDAKLGNFQGFGKDDLIIAAYVPTASFCLRRSQTTKSSGSVPCATPYL
jgi:hypothetical protein